MERVTKYTEKTVGTLNEFIEDAAYDRTESITYGLRDIFKKAFPNDDYLYVKSLVIWQMFDDYGKRWGISIIVHDCGDPSPIDEVYVSYSFSLDDEIIEKVRQELENEYYERFGDYISFDELNDWMLKSEFGDKLIKEIQDSRVQVSGAFFK